MILFKEPTTQLDDLLDRMAAELQLDATRYARMISHYEAVQKWIEADEQFFKPYKYDVYPHGSVKIRTTVKPIGKDEFDLDVVLQIKSNLTSHTPQRIYNELKRRLEEHETYRKILVTKNRCIRLNYTGDFHMDILPGIQESQWDANKLCVPDKELGTWVSSNPRGYSEWFLAKADLVRESLLEKALRAENLPADDFKDKKPLQRAVQLIKRYRDIYFQKDDTYKTSSIVLTTIAGRFYSGQNSIFETVDNIVTTVRSNIGNIDQRFKVLNPVNDQEDFTDKWDREPQYYEAFKKFSLHLYNEWQNLKRREGVLNEGTIMKGLFGDDLFVSAQRSQTNILDSYRSQNRLGIDKATGIISSAVTAASQPLRNNTFHGK